mmetsp:Transcript_6626/g.16076  ORF Transcript_6626/g.16076 Transcript_6626/m.16076 type:complete len:251 (-) Transcript_6626:3-755(-)
MRRGDEHGQLDHFVADAREEARDHRRGDEAYGGAGLLRVPQREEEGADDHVADDHRDERGRQHLGRAVRVGLEEGADGNAALLHEDDRQQVRPRDDGLAVGAAREGEAADRHAEEHDPDAVRVAEGRGARREVLEDDGGEDDREEEVEDEADGAGEEAAELLLRLVEVGRQLLLRAEDGLRHRELQRSARELLRANVHRERRRVEARLLRRGFKLVGGAPGAQRVGERVVRHPAPGLGRIGERAVAVRRA